ncbi:glycosyltransferase family 2 protein [Epilithonimonas vandammei]|uniref:Glycosyltransferase family 2 protein n=1 Tax=Epilithonimonas vandammei TaxID=2487072 RepID=A0A3G8Y6Z2_9FLAO|nr:glycosyltransferase family 2 protein [Epilithonimonas vandammei]AZI41129.1 glycosyltransferase family 2 protein [Epilithonimonas vandammei]
MFSVIIPYYKKRKYIERCMNSVLAQTYQDFEIILVDDGSQDDIAQLIEEKYLGKVQLIQQENQGVSAARNTGIAVATQDYIAFLDADDCWSTHFLSSVIEVIKNTDSDLIATNFTNEFSKLQIGEKKLNYKQMSEDEYLLKSSYSAVINSSSVVAKKGLFNKTLGFDITLKRGEDIEMWLRLVKHAEKFTKVKNILSFYDLDIVGQVTTNKSDFHASFASKLEKFSKVDQKNQLFARRFMYSRLFQYHFSNPEKTNFFIDFFKLNKPFFSFYKINPVYFYKFRNSNFRIVINTYLKLTVRLLK